MKERKHLLINLVIERRRRARLLEKRGRQMIWACVFLLAGIILYFLYSSIRIYTLQGDIRELDAKIESLRPTLNYADQLQKQIDALKPRLQLINKLRENVLIWHGLSLELQRLLPLDAWLDNVSFSPAAGGNIQISLSGKSLNYESIGDYMLRLQSAGHYQSVNLKSANLTKIAEREVVQFQMELQTIPIEGGSQ
ncbi:PilN domain-containing protein [bacterium]|nr:PilN domain-containing protein [bacterium]